MVKVILKSVEELWASKSSGYKKVQLGTKKARVPTAVYLLLIFERSLVKLNKLIIGRMKIYWGCSRPRDTSTKLHLTFSLAYSARQSEGNDAIFDHIQISFAVNPSRSEVKSMKIKWIHSKDETNLIFCLYFALGKRKKSL